MIDNAHGKAPRRKAVEERGIRLVNPFNQGFASAFVGIVSIRGKFFARNHGGQAEGCAVAHGQGVGVPDKAVELFPQLGMLPHHAAQMIPGEHVHHDDNDVRSVPAQAEQLPVIGGQFGFSGIMLHLGDGSRAQCEQAEAQCSHSPGLEQTPQCGQQAPPCGQQHHKRGSGQYSIIETDVGGVI